jgi:hypothetical protein
MCAEQRQRCLWIERVLLVIGIVCLGWWGMMSLQATHYQSQQRAALAQMREAAPAVANASATLPTGSLVGCSIFRGYGCQR